MILLQQQILKSKNTSDSQVPTQLEGRLPATSLEELKFVDREVGDGKVNSDLVCVIVTQLISLLCTGWHQKVDYNNQDYV